MPTAIPLANAEIRRLDAAFGAEVVGIDLAAPLSSEAFAALHDALRRHHFVCVRDQRLTEEQQIDLSARFGPLETFPERHKTRAGPTFYNVANVAPDGSLMSPSDPRLVAQKLNELWHTDSSYRFIPSYCSLLYAIEALPDAAADGETEFANMFLAYDALPEAMKRRIEPLQMVHDYAYDYRLFPDLPPLEPVVREAFPPASHPLVRVHPDRDGRRSLFITANTGREIAGLALDAGRALHAELVAHVSRSEFRLRHRWRTGDLMIWDNRCLLHRARAYDTSRYRRVARRTTVAGSAPVRGPFAGA
ncbi:MAG: TauD/TfdA family dioxygenase [Alphaproteobacteria bacterium]|nr:TauD/TfdA family dioxygenase [Alphaproteobacteria bacterium]